MNKTYTSDKYKVTIQPVNYRAENQPEYEHRINSVLVKSAYKRMMGGNV